MSAPAKPPTDLQIKAMKPPAARTEVPFGGGLYLVRAPSGTKSWALRYRDLNRKPTKLTLGRYMSASDMAPEVAALPVLGGPLSIAGARMLAQKGKLAMEQGLDPNQALQTGRARNGAEFAATFEDFLTGHVAVHNRSSTAKENDRLFRTKIKAAWKGRDLNSIGRRDVVLLLNKVRDDGAPVTANRVLALVRKFFGWCVEQGLLEASPCVGVRALTPEQSRDRHLADDEVALIWRASSKLTVPYRQFVRLLLLTGQRRGEAAQMTWSELSMADCDWTLPPQRTKNGRRHWVPLSDAAVAELESLPRLEGAPDYVFTGGLGRTGAGLAPVSGFSKIKAKLDQAVAGQIKADAVVAGKDPDKAAPMAAWRLHDLRRTVATGLQRQGVPLDVIEKTINHVSGVSSGIVGVYQVYDFKQERRNALDQWAKHVTALAAHDVEGSP